MHIKRILIAVFVILLIFAGCHPRKQSSQLSEVRAAWISYIELSTILDNRSEAEYVSGVKTMLENLKAMNFNTVYVHASAFTDAYYPSQYYPAAQYVAGQIGQQVSYDPFGLFVEQAHQAGFHIEAWINPMRSFRTDQDSQFLTLVIGQWLRILHAGNTDRQEGDRWYLNPAYWVRDLTRGGEGTGAELSD
ncbi:MAG: family 10 glycosylhydrolase [Holdemania massiliensis]